MQNVVFQHGGELSLHDMWYTHLYPMPFDTFFDASTPVNVSAVLSVSCSPSCTHSYTIYLFKDDQVYEHWYVNDNHMEFKRQMKLEDWYGPYWSGYRPQDISAALDTDHNDVHVLFEHEYFYVINRATNVTVKQATVYKN